MMAIAPPVSTGGVGALRATLALLHGRVLNYLPHQALLVAAPRSAVRAMRVLPGKAADFVKPAPMPPEPGQHCSAVRCESPAAPCAAGGCARGCRKHHAVAAR